MLKFDGEWGRGLGNPVWAAGAAPDEIVIDLDGTLVDAHSEKQDATPTYKRGFGFYPILAYLDVFLVCAVFSFMFIPLSLFFSPVKASGQAGGH